MTEPKSQPPNVNIDVTTESESKASENPHPTGRQEVVVEPPAEKTKQAVREAIKETKDAESIP